MPYTPPAPQSPVASKSSTPALSRSQSHNKAHRSRDAELQQGTGHEYPHSPSSRSYLSKHRRSPSITQPPSSASPNGLSTPDTTPLDQSPGNDDETVKSHPQERSSKSATSTTRANAEISPPVSPQSSSDEENGTKRGRSRGIAKLAELQAAIQIIEQHRVGSPDRQTNNERKKARSTLGLAAPRLDLSNLVDGSQAELPPRLPLSSGARKISHSRSTTDASAFFEFPRNKFDSPMPSTSQSDDEDFEDDELEIKPALIRKKSGELVRPALRASSTRRRPSSMPGTPTYSKAVHFQENSLEHVRHFLQVDRPIAVSAGTSPADSYDDETEYPFDSNDRDSRSAPYEWEIRVPNFPRNNLERRALPVWTEKIYLSTDTRVLIGSVVVRNLAFHKMVVARFTLDYWKTTSEVVAEYDSNVRGQDIDAGCDRFTFTVKLEDQANLENKTMFFCVKYNVNGQDYWDNNRSVNYQVDFAKRCKPQNSKTEAQAKSSRPLNALPRGRPSTTSFGRPRSMPSFDDFAGMVSPYDFSSFPQPSAVVGDSPIRFRSKPPKEILPDAPGRPKESTSQQAFGNRYDFGASLSAAIQGAGSMVGSDRSGPLRRKTTYAPAQVDGHNDHAAKAQSTSDAKKTTERSAAPEVAQRELPKPTALTSEKPGLSSSSYHELLDKYCFFGSGKSTSRASKPAPSQLDGASDDLPKSEDLSKKNSTSTGTSSPRASPPLIEDRKPTPKFLSPPDSRSPSPATGSAVGSRSATPAFGYPYHQSLQTGLFDTHAPTAIRG